MADVLTPFRAGLRRLRDYLRAVALSDGRSLLEAGLDALAARVLELGAVSLDGWEYGVTTGPRRTWADADTPPPGEGWERDLAQGSDGGWERFEFHEESYWRRRGRRPATREVGVRKGELLSTDGCSQILSTGSAVTDALVLALGAKERELEYLLGGLESEERSLSRRRDDVDRVREEAQELRNEVGVRGVPVSGDEVRSALLYKRTRRGAELAYAEQTSLGECPVGLFVPASGALCVKLEYRDGGHLEAYVVGTGEAFWGGATLPEDRSRLRVRPVDLQLR